MARGLSIRGTAVGSGLALAYLIAFVDTHNIAPPIAERFAFPETKKAYQVAASGSLFGKVVLTVAD